MKHRARIHPSREDLACSTKVGVGRDNGVNPIVHLSNKQGAEKRQVSVDDQQDSCTGSVLRGDCL
jgi:hypothetical protein